MSTLSTVINGSLKPDGTLVLDTPPKLPPGRVQVTLQVLPQETQDTVRLPDVPLEDGSVSAPFDLPHPAKAERVYPKQVAERLPEPLEWSQEEGG